jgi:hypothetical protein
VRIYRTWQIFELNVSYAQKWEGQIMTGTGWYHSVDRPNSILAGRCSGFYTTDSVSPHKQHASASTPTGNHRNRTLNYFYAQFIHRVNIFLGNACTFVPKLLVMHFAIPKLLAMHPISSNPCQNLPVRMQLTPAPSSSACSTSSFPTSSRPHRPVPPRSYHTNISRVHT